MTLRHTLSILGLASLTLITSREAYAAQATCQDWSVSAGWWTNAYAVTTADLHRIDGDVQTFVERSVSSVLFPSGGGTLAFSGTWSSSSLGGTYIVHLQMTIYSGLDHVPTPDELAAHPAAQTKSITGSSQSFVCMAPEPQCGNAIQESGEPCDDGNLTGGDGCSKMCTLEPYGCTYRLRYWKKHHPYARKRRHQINWPLSPDTRLCGDTWVEILQERPRHRIWNRLARRYIAARLNVANGASSGLGTEAALAEAEAILSDCTVSRSERRDAHDVAELLRNYNNGAIGPGHCD